MLSLQICRLAAQKTSQQRYQKYYLPVASIDLTPLVSRNMLSMTRAILSMKPHPVIYSIGHFITQSSSVISQSYGPVSGIQKTSLQVCTAATESKDKM